MGLRGIFISKNNHKRALKTIFNWGIWSPLPTIPRPPSRSEHSIFSSQVFSKQICFMDSETWKMCICCSSLPGLWFSPQTPALPVCQISLKEGPWAGDPRVSSVAKSASESSISEPPNPANCIRPAENLPLGLKHVRSQDIAAKSRGPETKHLWGPLWTGKGTAGWRQKWPQGAGLSPASWHLRLAILMGLCGS